jgi:signal transduction histidine kinase
MKKFAVSFVFMFLLASGVYASDDLSGFGVKLNGMHKFKMGDAAGWERIDYDDSGWDTVYIPSNFNILYAFKPFGVVWYRLRFNAPPELKNLRTGIFLGRIADADETYLNGVKIGSTGDASKAFVEAGNIYRLYEIPPGLLKISGESVLAVRTRYTQNYWGFFDENIVLGDYNRLFLETTRKAHAIEIFESCFITALLLTLVGCSFLYIHGTRDREYVYLWFFVFAYAAFFILDSNTFYSTGAQTAWMQSMVFFFLTLGSAFLTMFLTHACGARVSVQLKALIAVLLAVAVLHLVSLPPFLQKLLFSVRILSLAITAMYYLYVTAKAYIDKKHEAGIILAGVLFYVAGSRTELMGGISFQKYSGLFLIDYSIAAFLLCMTYAMTARFNRINKILKHMTDKVLDAHEEERKRIARDMHDVVGQGLLAIKLNLQMLKSRVKNNESVTQEDFGRIIDETSSCIDEVRLISMDLRPSFIDNMDFTDSLLWHAENFRKKTGVSVLVEAEPAGNLPVRIKDNLYRIYQEALTNAVKHSKADTIKVQFFAEGGIITLRILDNGHGFDVTSPDIYNKGIGLESIRERTQLIGGVFSIKSSGKGTIIAVEVKTHD